MSTKFSLFPAAATPVLADQVAGLQGGVDKLYTFTQIAALLGIAKFAANIGDATNVSYLVNHALGTRDVTVTVYRNAAPYDEVICDVQHTDANNVTFVFSTAPAVNQFRVLIRA